MSPSPVLSPRRSRRAVAIALVAALGLSACAGQLSDEEVLKANGVRPGSSASGSSASDGGVPLEGTTGDPAEAGAGDGTATTVVGGPAPSSGSAGTTVPGATGGPTEAAVGTPGEKGPIILGNVGNYSGPAGSAQADIPRGVQIWVAAVNARGGLFGRPVQVIVQDDGGDPARYAALVQDMVENRGVVAFVGNAATLSMGGGIEYLNAHGIPVFGSECSRVEWSEHPVFFPQCTTVGNGMLNLLRESVKITGKRRFGFVACTEAASCTGYKSVILERGPSTGVQIVYRSDISITQIDFTAQCRGAQEAKVELMFVVADANTLARFARSCARQGFAPQYLAASLSLTPDALAQPGLERVIVGSSVFPLHATAGPAVGEFQAAVRRFAGTATAGMAHGWVAGKLFEEVATRAARASRSISSKTLVTAGHTIKGETLGGLSIPLDFSGPTPKNAPCGFVEQADGKGGWVLPLGPAPQCP